MSARVAIVQARCSSSRFPAKVLQPLQGRPLILFMLDRVRRARRIDTIMLATSDDPSDQALADAVTAEGIPVYRGPLDDVLARFAGAAQAAQAEVVVRLTGDCPLIDPDLIDSVVDLLETRGAAYASNCSPPGWPDGLDVEAMTASALMQAHQEATLPSHREHVTLFLRQHPDRFAACHLQPLLDMSALRWTVDYPDDLAFVRELLSAAQVQSSTSFDRFDLLRTLERRPELAGINRHQRNEGLAASLAKDPSP
jgi:spore coat polysaccharide biosynthesis protein SpsF